MLSSNVTLNGLCGSHKYIDTDYRTLCDLSTVRVPHQRTVQDQFLWMGCLI